MKTYHVQVQAADGGYLAAHALEDESVHTQGKSIDEVIRNILEVAALLYDETEVQIELIIPPDLKVA